ncbi:MAG: hypothetical protein AAF617_05710 [Bacteroidota bacterium]
MIFKNDQFVAIAFLFEKENGNTPSEYEESVINLSKLKTIPVPQLETFIIEGLHENAYKIEKTRTSAYWALSKRFNPKLIPHFKVWLQKEIDAKKSTAMFQLMLALDKVDEPVFHPSRNSSAVDEVELNLRDAKHYLAN